MKSYLAWDPPRDICGEDRFGRSYTVHFPGRWFNCVPTLQAAFAQLERDLGPLNISWHDGLLCPFHPDVGTKNIHCCAGRRKPRGCGGILITKKLVPHMPDLAGGVVCYNWETRLLYALYDLAQDRDLMASWPDDPAYVATKLLALARQKTLWYDWWAELENRANRLHRRLMPLPQHQGISGPLAPR